MKVALVSRFPKQIEHPRGGVETATVGLARALRSIGVDDVHILTLEKGVGAPVIEEHEGITVHRLKRSSFPMIIDCLKGPTTHRLKQYLDELQPSIVHYHETWGFSAPECGFPAVFTVHGFDSLNLPTENAPFWWLRSLFWKVAETIGLRNQKFIISIAPYVRDAIEQKTKAKIFDIWNSLSPTAYEITRAENSRSVLFLGWLNPRKNPIVIVEAAAIIIDKFPELTVHICGEAADQDYAKQLEEKISQLGLNDSILLPGRLDQLQVRNELASAAVLVLPSFQENAPMVIAEAMAAGIPIVASNLCGIPDMVENGVSGLLLSDPTNPQELAKAIERLLDDDDLRHSLGSSAGTRAQKLFHPHNVAKKTVEAYNSAIAAYLN